MMLHHGDDNFVTFATKCLSKRKSHKIDRFSGASGKYNFLTLAGTQKFSDVSSRFLMCFSGFLT